MSRKFRDVLNEKAKLRLDLSIPGTSRLQGVIWNWYSMPVWTVPDIICASTITGAFSGVTREDHEEDPIQA